MEMTQGSEVRLVKGSAPDGSESVVFTSVLACFDRHPPAGCSPQGSGQHHQEVTHSSVVRPADDFTQEQPRPGGLGGRQLPRCRDPVGEDHRCVLAT